MTIVLSPSPNFITKNRPHHSPPKKTWSFITQTFWDPFHVEKGESKMRIDKKIWQKARKWSPERDWNMQEKSYHSDWKESMWPTSFCLPPLCTPLSIFFWFWSVDGQKMRSKLGQAWQCGNHPHPHKMRKLRPKLRPRRIWTSRIQRHCTSVEKRKLRPWSEFPPWQNSDHGPS